MDETILISSMALLIMLAALCSIVLTKLRLPALIGFLVAGIVISNCFELSEDMMSVVKIFSDLGLIMLMLAIGLEIDIRKIREQGVFAIIVAAVQLPLMLVGGTVAGTFLGFNMVESIVLGAVISGSSTAVVLSVLKTQGIMSSEQIESIILITIMEDIGQVIILSMITPMMEGGNLNTLGIANLLISIAFFMIICFIVGLRVIPRLIDWIGGRISDELVSLLCVGLAFSLAMAANLMGLSVAIGSFLMGVMVASTAKRDIVERYVSPLKSLFMAMFFIFVGMEVSINALMENVGLIAVFFLVFAGLKTVTVFIGYWIGNEKPRNGFVSAVSLCAMGEFAFIISKQALDAGAVTDTFYSSVIGAALVSMFVLPFLARGCGSFWDKMESISPKPLRRLCLRINEGRSKSYAAILAMSNNVRKRYLAGLGHAYLCILIVIVVELTYYFFYDAGFDWLIENVYDAPELWDFLLMSINFWILLPPCWVIIRSLRVMMYAYSLGLKRLTGSKLGEGRGRPLFYEGVNPLIAGVLLDMFILLVFPNETQTLYSAINLLIAAVVIIAIRTYRLRSGKAKLVPLPDIRECDEQGDGMQ